MTERLDRIEATLERTAQQQERNASDIETLLGAVSTYDLEAQKLHADVAALVRKIDESNQRFETLRLEAQRDREEYRELFNDAIAQMDKQQKDWQGKFDNQQSVIERLLLSLLDRSDAQERLNARVARLERPREAG